MKPLQFYSLTFLHIFNDSTEAMYTLLLPFIAHDFHIDLSQVGFLGSLLFLFNIILAIPSVRIARRFGGMQTLVGAMAFYTLGLLGVSFTHSFWQVLPMFVLGSIGLALFHPIAFALVAKWTTKESRGKILGDFTAYADLLKAGITTLVVFLIGIIGWQWSVRGYSIVALICVVVYIFILRNNHSSSVSTEPTVANIPWLHVLKNKPYIGAVLSNTVDNFASQTFFMFLPFLLLHQGFSHEQLGLLTGTFFIGSFVGRIILGRLTDTFPSAFVFIGSELLMALFIVLLAIPSPLLVTVIYAFILGGFTKGTAPIMNVMISESVDHHGNYEKAFSMKSLISNTTVVIAPTLLGVISQSLGIVYAFYVMALFAVLAVIPAVYYHLTLPRIAKTER